jgi:hypothetical protein
MMKQHIFAAGDQVADMPTATVAETMRCAKCGSESPIVMIWAGPSDPARWPKSIQRGNSLYVFIKCPICGEREQLVGRSGDADGTKD